MSALAKIKQIETADAVIKTSARTQKFIPRVVPLVTVSQPKKKALSWWMPLGAGAFFAGLLSAAIYMDHMPLFFEPVMEQAQTIVPPAADVEAAASYAETIYPPPNDVVVPVPVVPDMMAAGSKTSNNIDVSAGISLPVSSTQAFLPQPKAKHAAVKAVAATAPAKTDDEPQIMVQSEVSPEDMKLLDEAQAKLDSEDDTGAIVIYDRILQNNRNNYAAMAGKAFALQRSGKYEAAVSIEHRLLKLDPTDDDIRANLVTALGAWASPEAFGELQRMVNKKPDYAPAQAALAMALMRRGDVLQSLPHAKRAILADPQNVAYELDLAIIYDQLGHSGEAAAHYRNVLKAYDVEDAPLTLPSSVTSIQQRLTYLESLMASADNISLDGQ